MDITNFLLISLSYQLPLIVISKYLFNHICERFLVMNISVVLVLDILIISLFEVHFSLLFIFGICVLRVYFSRVCVFSFVLFCL